MRGDGTTSLKFKLQPTVVTLFQALLAEWWSRRIADQLFQLTAFARFDTAGAVEADAFFSGAEW
jgi:hypothetical protein